MSEEKLKAPTPAEQIEKNYHEGKTKRGVRSMEVILVITAPRHASTFLCNALQNHFESEGETNTVSAYECFKEAEDTFGLHGLEGEELTKAFGEVLESMGDKRLVAKVFPDHTDIEALLDTPEADFKVIFLKRNIHDSYVSYLDAMATGNWGTTPQRKQEHKPEKNYKSPIPLSESIYTDRVLDFRKKSLQAVKERGIPFITVTFHEVIAPEFSIASTLNKLTNG